MGSCGKKKKRPKCCPPKCPKCPRRGRATRNAFFNFLREYRRQHCGIPVSEVAKQGALAWNCMTESQKCKYMSQAAKARPFKKKNPCGRCPKKKRRRSSSCKKRRRSSSCGRKRSRSRSCRRKPKRKKC